MSINRLEAFSDGVIAIIITIMVLELKIPMDSNWNSLFKLYPVFISYILSFLYVGIYWNNHHHLLHVTKHINALIMWNNHLLLFFLSLIPFGTAWMGEHHFEQNTVIVYGIILLMCAISFMFLQLSISKCHHDQKVVEVLQSTKLKGYISIIGYILAIALAFFQPYLSFVIYLLVGISWLIPDKAIEKL